MLFEGVETDYHPCMSGGLSGGFPEFWQYLPLPPSSSGKTLLQRASFWQTSGKLQPVLAKSPQAV